MPTRMHGSIHEGYAPKSEPVPEFNVYSDVPSCQHTLHAPWKSTTITPLDTCGRIMLRKEQYRALQTSTDPIAVALLDNYRTWHANLTNKMMIDLYNPAIASSILFDTVAVLLAYDESFLEMIEAPVQV